MEIRTDIPAPKSLATLLREIPVGASALFEGEKFKAGTVRSTLSRLKEEGRDYTTLPEGDGLRVWRTA